MKIVGTAIVVMLVSLLGASEETSAEGICVFEMPSTLVPTVSCGAYVDPEGPYVCVGYSHPDETCTLIVIG